MQEFIKTYIMTDDVPDFALLIPDKFDVIKGAVYFLKAGKIEVKYDKFLAYKVYLDKKQFILVESGYDKFSMFSCLNELKDKGVKNFLLLNKGYNINKTKLSGEFFLVKKSILSSTNKAVSLNSKIVKAFQEHSDINSIIDYSVDSESLFFSANNKMNKKDLKCDMASMGDYFFLNFMKEYKLSGAVINYIINKDETDNKIEPSFNNVMNFIVEFLNEVDVV